LRFRAALAAERVPRAAVPALRALLRSLPGGDSDRHVLSRARRFARFMHLPLLERLARWNSLFQDDVSQLLDGARLPAAASLHPLDNVRRELDAIARYSPLAQLLAANFASYLPDDLLVKTDRCTMAASLEARSPFLDRALIEFVAVLPDTMKLEGRRTKTILRDAFADLLPPEIERRGKMGFGVPLGT